MTGERRHSRSVDDRLEERLRTAAREARYPATPPIAETVRRRLDTESVQPRRGTGWFNPRRTRPRSARAFGLALVVLVVVATSVSAIVVGLPNLRIIFVHTPP